MEFRTETQVSKAYVWLFWGFEIGDVMLRAAVLGEVLWHAFPGTQVERTRVLAWSAALSVALPVVAGPMQATLIWSVFAKGNMAVAILSLLAIAALLLTRGRTGLALAQPRGCHRHRAGILCACLPCAARTASVGFRTGQPPRR